MKIKSNRLLIPVLAIACISLIVLVAWKVNGTDRTPPEIAHSGEILYFDEAHGAESLLVGVTAVDDKDGDVSHSLIIRDLYRVSDEYGIVVYAAKDAANNVNTLSRGFVYVVPAEEVAVADEPAEAVEETAIP